MNNKKYLYMGAVALLMFSIFASYASAASLSLTQTKAITYTNNGTISVKNTGATNWVVQLSDSGSFDVGFYDSNGNLANTINLNAGETKTITVVPTNLDNQGFGSDSSVTVTAQAFDSGTLNETATLNMKVSGAFCKAGSVGNDLEIRNVRVDNNGNGKDDEWDLLDSVEIEVEVENVGNDKVRDIVVEMGFFDSEGKNQVSDLDFENSDEEKIDLGSLSDGDSETVTFTFKVPADYEDGTYKLTFKAYSDDVGEDEQCVDKASDLDNEDLYNTIDVNRESDEGKFIAFDNIRFTPSEGTCGESITMSMDVYNIGDEDQDQVKITLTNTELGINQFVEIRNNLDQGDKESVSFDFVVPQNAQDKFYTLRLSSDYDYRNGNYRQTSDEDVNTQFRVLGCGTNGGTGGTGSGGRIAVISAKLESSDVSPGSKVVVRATVTNLKSERAALAVDAVGYQSWGSLDEVSPRLLDLPAEQSQDVLLTFTLDDDASGENSFDIQVKDGSGNTETREVALNVAESQSSGGFSFGGNSFLWIIGAVNVILIILIIIVAVRVARSN